MFIQDDTFNNFPKMYTRHDYYSASTIRDTRVYDIIPPDTIFDIL